MDDHDLQIAHSKQLLATYRRNLALYLRQRAHLGAAHIPPGVYNGIIETQAEIARLKASLHVLGVTVADQPNDTTSVDLLAPPLPAPAWRVEDRRAMLANVQRVWIDGVLHQSLWNDALIVLRLAEQRDAVQRPYGLRLRADGDAPLPAGTTIQDVYDAQNGALLILGQPGSGKTTLLLELTKTLLDRADGDLSHPIPVVFNLASWQVHQTLTDWLVRQLKREYSVPQKIGQAWVEAGALLPLLDGLDEVAEQSQALCVAAINAYRTEYAAAWATPIVVCCRAREYAALPPLQLHGAIMVQPLMRAEIDAYLRDGGRALAGVRAMVKDDLTLYELLETPLLLAVTTLAFAGQAAAELRRMGSPETRRQAIFAAFVARQLQPPPEGKGADPSYGETRTLRWLTWLAGQMCNHNESVYWIEFMQVSWLPRKWMRWGMLVFSGFAGGSVAGIAGGLSGALIGAALGGIRSAFLIGSVMGCTCLAFGVFVSVVTTTSSVDKVSWNIYRLFTQVILMWVCMLLLGIIISNLRAIYDIDELYSLFIYSFSGGIFGITLGKIGGSVQLHIIDYRAKPNEGFWRSMRYGIVNTMLSIFTLAISAGIGYVLGIPYAMSVGIAIGLIIGLFNGLQYGGVAVIKQATLRACLALTGTFPWNIAAFLDSCAQRRLVQRVGGGWRFPHNLIRDYFAQLKVEGKEQER
jgi:eukaryotic-like serine/threonine-protein kinase